MQIMNVLLHVMMHQIIVVLFMFLIKWVTRNKPPNVEAKLNVPHGILLDDEGNWLTLCYSDSESCWVERRAKSDEDEDRELIKYWKNKDFHGPSALAIKRDQTLVVGDRDDSMISLFKQIKTK
jgi:hypothetical protein